eukprot:6147017-Prorocentrum_lima.AAC.1
MCPQLRVVEVGTLRNLMKSCDVLHECGWDHRLLALRQQRQTAPLDVLRETCRLLPTMFTSESVG